MLCTLSTHTTHSLPLSMSLLHSPPTHTAWAHSTPSKDTAHSSISNTCFALFPLTPLILSLSTSLLRSPPTHTQHGPTVLPPKTQLIHQSLTHALHSFHSHHSLSVTLYITPSPTTHSHTAWAHSTPSKDTAHSSISNTCFALFPLTPLTLFHSLCHSFTHHPLTQHGLTVLPPKTQLIHQFLTHALHSFHSHHSFCHSPIHSSNHSRIVHSQYSFQSHSSLITTQHMPRTNTTHSLSLTQAHSLHLRCPLTPMWPGDRVGPLQLTSLLKKHFILLQLTAKWFELFIFDRCHHTYSALTPVKYQCGI